MGYNDELEFVANSPDNIFPDYLFNPMTNDFDEDYYAKGVSNDPLIMKAKSIRRKYSNYFDYIDAINLYNEYIDLLIDKYGSWSLIKNSYKVGMLDEILPPKPRLKRNRKNKEYMRAGIIPSRKYNEAIIEDVDILNAAREAFPNEFGQDITEDAAFEKPKKANRKILKKMKEELSAKTRRKNLYSTVGNNRGTDFIIEYFNQVNRGGYNEEGEYKEKSISEIYKDQEDSLLIPDILMDDALLSNTPIIVGGRYVKRSEIAQIELLKELYENGIDLIGAKSKSMDRTAVKLLRRQLGAYDSGPMTKKELKKWKKKGKDEKRRLERQTDADSNLERILLKNKISFANKGNSINFRLRDIYRDGDEN